MFLCCFISYSTFICLLSVINTVGVICSLFLGGIFSCTSTHPTRSTRALAVSHGTSYKSNLNFLIMPLCLLPLSVCDIRAIALCKFPLNSSFIVFPSFFFFAPLLSPLHSNPPHSLPLSYDHEQFIKNVCLWGEVCSWVLEDFLTSNEIAKQNYL